MPGLLHSRIEDLLTASQREAVFHRDGPLLVVAGPGSGKTRVITYRIAALIDTGVRSGSVCAITFTNKAAEEMRRRVAVLGAPAGSQISTFHSLCVGVLRRYAQHAGIRPNFSIYDEKDQERVVKGAIAKCDLDTRNFSPGKVLATISKLKNELVDDLTYSGQADGFFSKRLAAVYSCYQKLLADCNALDFDDLLLKTALLLRSHRQVAEQLSERFRYLLIDEYQDTNHAQYVIARELVCTHNNICATGDPDQSIYSWRGADIRNILSFEHRWPEAKVVKLEENFRSTPAILKAADNLIAANIGRKAKKLIAIRTGGSDVSVAVYQDAEAEAEAVAARIKQLAGGGTALSEMAIFYRVNATSRLIEEAFIRNGIPYRIVRGVEFYGRKEIRDVLAYLRVTANPDDREAILRIINTPARGIGKTALDRAAAYAADRRITLFDALGKAADIAVLNASQKKKILTFVSMIEGFRACCHGGIEQLVLRVLEESGLRKYLEKIPEGQDALDNTEELVNSASQYDRQAAEPSLTDYLQQISLFSDADRHDASRDRVLLMTLHAAKGLEFKTVFIVGLEEGLLPHGRSLQDGDAMEEERRLFFVGITRAINELYISRARYRSIHGQVLQAGPSPFLYEINVDQVEQEAGCQPAFEDGAMVRHSVFGTGKVTEFIDMGENSMVVVKFSSGRPRTLMLKHANLVLI